MPNPLNTIASIGSINTPIPQTQIGNTTPTTREGGQPLQDGDRWFNPDDNQESIYYQNEWRLINSFLECLYFEFQIVFESIAYVLS